MIIKSFTAATSAAALKLVREEMGGDAIVLRTTRVVDPRLGRHVEITACLENPTVDQSSKILADQNKRLESKIQPEAVDVETHSNVVATSRDYDAASRSILQLNDVPEHIIAALLDNSEKATEPEANDTDKLLPRISEELSAIMLPELPFKRGDKVLFVGPAGSGKSSAMGKLAAHLVARKKQKVTLATLDDLKIGAFEEIRTYADCLELKVADLNEKLDKSVVSLIDTPALLLGENSRRDLFDQVNLLQPDYCFLVFSSLMRSREVARYCEMAAALQPTHLIMTNLDQTNALGGIFVASQESGLKIAFVTDAPGGMGMISSPDPYKTAARLLALEDVHEPA